MNFMNIKCRIAYKIIIRCLKPKGQLQKRNQRCEKRRNITWKEVPFFRKRNPRTIFLEALINPWIAEHLDHNFYSIAIFKRTSTSAPSCIAQLIKKHEYMWGGMSSRSYTSRFIFCLPKCPPFHNNNILTGYYLNFTCQYQHVRIFVTERLFGIIFRHNFSVYFGTKTTGAHVVLKSFSKKNMFFFLFSFLFLFLC